MQKHFLVYIIIILTAISCTQQKQITYLQDIDKRGDKNFFPKEKKNYKIQAQDILYIKIITTNQEISQLFTNYVSSVSQTNSSMGGAGMYINGYVVNDSGFVSIPTIGDVKVLYKTLEEAKQIIEAEASKFVKKFTVEVKLMSFKFTVLGEVRRPGIYMNYNNQLNVLEAIGMAGDLTEYSNRKRILVLRPVENGTETFRMDLTNTKILSSDAFFLFPNDIVYIEPIKNKILRLNAPNISLLFSSISTLLLVVNFINNNK